MNFILNQELLVRITAFAGALLVLLQWFVTILVQRIPV